MREEIKEERDQMGEGEENEYFIIRRERKLNKKTQILSVSIVSFY